MKQGFEDAYSLLAGFNFADDKSRENALPGVSGQTISDIDDYLGDPRMLQEMEVRELAAMRQRELVEEIDAKEIDPEGEAHALRRRLCAAVNAHWHQLIAIGAV